MTSFEELSNRVPEILNVMKHDTALSNMILDMINNRVSSLDDLTECVPEILDLFKNDTPLANMILDMINKL
jgi:hypothetical protein